MKEPHNYKIVGYSMILIAISLTAIALLYLAIGNNVLYGDNIQREKTIEYEKQKQQLETENFLESYIILQYNKRIKYIN